MPDAPAETDDEADAEGMADIAAGRVIPHEIVAGWLDTWGTEHERPPPSLPF